MLLILENVLLLLVGRVWEKIEAFQLKCIIEGKSYIELDVYTN